MPIRYEILGAPGDDNALYVELDTGRAVHRMLFDCGQDCLSNISISRIQAIDGLYFSHFHMDHVAGFDTYLRFNFARPHRPIQIWGPAGAREVLHHRLQGVTWNLVSGSPGEFLIHEIGDELVTTSRFLTGECFAVEHPVAREPFHGIVRETPDYVVEARLMAHGVPSAAYCVREKPKAKVDPAALRALGLGPGKWLAQVKEPKVPDETVITVEGRSWPLAELRKRLLLPTPGDSIAYLTDFRLDAPAERTLTRWLAGCRVMVCENNFRDSDQQLAERSYHMVSSDVARLARACSPARLVLFHVSDRYTPEQWLEQLQAVRAQFPETHFPDGWNIGGE